MLTFHYNIKKWHFENHLENFKIHVNFQFISKAGPIQNTCIFTSHSIRKLWLTITLVLTKTTSTLIMPLDLINATRPHRNIDLTNHTKKLWQFPERFLGPVANNFFHGTRCNISSVNIHPPCFFFISKNWISTPLFRHLNNFCFFFDFKRKPRDSAANGTSASFDSTLSTYPICFLHNCRLLHLTTSNTAKLRNCGCETRYCRPEISRLWRNTVTQNGSNHTRENQTTMAALEQPNYQRSVDAIAEPPKDQRTPNWLPSQLPAQTESVDRRLSL